MASGPVAMCGWRFRSSLCTPSHSMLNVTIVWYGQPSIFGMLFGSPSVKRLENCWLSIAAFVLESFCRSPSLLSGAMPLLSHLLVLMKEYSFLGSRSSDTVVLM